MATMYPQFAMRVGPNLAWWEGWLQPFRSQRRRLYRVVMAYNGLRDPLAWIAKPEISRRTWPQHRHLYAIGVVCPRFPADNDWRYGRDDISRYLDLVVLWLGCHIHLEELGRWPGPEAPDAERHGPSSFQSDDERLERLTRAFVARFGMRALRQLLPTAGVPLEVLEREDWARLIVRAPTADKGERSA
jgi:hypothetical protein